MRIYIGADSYAKRLQVFKQLIECGEATVITPEQSTLSYESQMIRMLDLPGLIDVQVTSFNHLLQRLSTDIFTPEQEHITAIGKKMLFRQVMDELGKKLQVFRNIDKEGFYDALEDTFDKLAQDDLGPEVFERLLEEQPQDSLIYRKLSDLKLIYQTFSDRIRDQYFDHEKMLERFEEDGANYRLYSSEHVWLVDFKHLDAGNLRMLRSIEQHTGQVHVVLPYEQGKPWIYQVTEETLRLLRETFKHVEVIDLKRTATPITALVEAMVSPYEEAITLPQGALRIFEANDPYEEVEFIGLDILKKMREHRDLRLEDIRIITADLKKYEFILKSVFAQFGIPIFSDDRKSLVKNRIVKSILALMNIYIDRYRRDDILSFLKGYLEEDLWDELDVFENYCIEKGIDRKRFKEPFKDAAMEALRKKLLSEVIHWEDFYTTPKSVPEFCDGLREQLIKLKYPERIEQEANRLKEREQKEEMLVLTQVWNVLIEAIAQLKKVSTDKPVRFRVFKRYMDASIKDLSVGVIPPVEGKITLATLHRSTHVPCKVLYFCGMNEGVLPKEYLDTGLLKHQEKRRIQSFGYRYFDTPEFNEALDILDQTIALSMVSDQLIFTYALGDYSKDGERASAYIGLVRSLSGVSPERTLKDHYYENRQVAIRYAIEALRDKRSEAIHQLTQAEIDALKDELARPIYTPPIRRDMDTFKASVSKLERFRRCPFQYFVQYDLLPAERRELRVELFDIGELYHLLIERAIAAYHDRTLERQDLEVYLDALMQELLKEEAFEKFTASASARYFIKKAKRIAAFVIDVLITNIERSQYEPTHFEKWIKVDLDAYELRGKIDRVDVKDNRFTVIDYKTGSKQFNLNSIYQGVDLQLTLYADAFKNEQAGMQPAGMFYFNIKDPILEEDKDRRENLRLSGLTIGDIEGMDEGGDYKFLPTENIPPKLMDKLSEHVRNTGIGYIREIGKGEIHPHPLKMGMSLNCTYCDYHAVCRFDRMQKGFEVDEIETLNKEQIYALLQEDEHEVDR